MERVCPTRACRIGKRKTPAGGGGFFKLSGGSDRRRSGDLSIFSRTLYQLSYRANRLSLFEKKPYLATLTGLEPATSAVTGRRANQLRYRAKLCVLVFRDPNGIRTRVNAVKGRRPRPLNDGAMQFRTT